MPTKQVVGCICTSSEIAVHVRYTGSTRNLTQELVYICCESRSNVKDFVEH